MHRLRHGIMPQLRLCGILMLIIALAPPLAQAAPASIQIHGVLVDGDQAPLTGLRKWQVRFFNAPTSGTQVGGTQTSATLLSARGEFSIPATLPAQAAGEAQLWYELAIDSDNPANGDAADDVFANRFQVHAVPFAVYASALAQNVSAAQVGDGSVADNEFQSLKGVRSGIQGQLDAKAGAAQVYTRTESDAQRAALNASITSQGTVLATHTAQLASQAQTLSQKANIASVYNRAQIDILQSIQNELNTSFTQAFRRNDVTLTSHTLAFRRDGALLTSHTQQLAALRAIPPSYSRIETDSMMADKADKASVYTQAQIDSQMAAKADRSSVYTQAQIDSQQAAQDALASSHTLALGSHDGLLTSHTLAFRRDDALLTSHAQQLAALQAVPASYSQPQIDGQLAGKADKASVYTKAEVDAQQADQDTRISAKADAATVYTMGQVDSALGAKADKASVYTQTQIDSQQAAQDLVIAGKANLSEVYTRVQVDGQQFIQDTAIDAKANKADVYTKSEVNDSQSAQDAVISSHTQAFRRDDALLTSHTLAFRRDDALLTSHAQQLAMLHAVPASYSQAQIDSWMAGKADINSVYTQAQIDSRLADKADNTSVYTQAQIDGQQAAQDSLISSHTLAFRRDDALLTSHTLAFRRDDALLTSHAQQLSALQSVPAGYSQAQIDSQMADKADKANVYTQAQIDSQQAAQDALISSHTMAFLRNDAALTSHAQQLATLQAAPASYSQTQINTLLNDKADKTSVYTTTQIDAQQAAQDAQIGLKANSADVYAKAQVDSALGAKANAADVYTNAQIDSQQTAQNTLIAAKANSADVYTQAQADARYLQPATGQNLTLSSNAQAITHTGATGLTVASQNGYVDVEGVRFTGNQLGVSGNAAVTSLSATKLAINTTSTLAGSMTAGSGLLHVDATNGRVGVGSTSPATRFEVKALMGSMTNIATAGTPSASSTYNVTYNAGNAFDSNNSTFWASIYQSPVTHGEYLLYDFGADAAQIITGYRLKQVYSFMNITGWKFQGSNDNASWTDLDVRSGHAYTAATEEFTFNNQTAYRYYRFNIPTSNMPSDGQVAISTLEMFSRLSTSVLTVGADAYPRGVGIGKTLPASFLDVAGSLALPIRSAGANTTLVDADYTLVATAAITVGLPAAASCTGRVYVIKRETGAGNVIIDPNASETIDGAATRTIDANYTAITVQSDGSAWHTALASAGGGSVDLSNYFTKTEVNTALAAKANSSDMTTALSAKADASSVYAKSEVFTKAEADARYAPIGGGGGAESDTLDSVTGRGATTTNAVTVGSLTSSGPVTISNAAAPGTTTNKLYAASGNLYWNGTQLNGGGGSGDGVTAPVFYGDGSAGALTINSDTNWNNTPPAGFNTKYTDVTINATLTVPSGTKLYCTGNLTIGASGKIIVEPFAGPSSAGISGAPALNGVGGIGIASDFQAAMIRNPDLNGGGGGVTRNGTYGSGGYGGGTLLLLCQGNITIQGSIQANGADATNPNTASQGIQGSGGGAGGVIVLASAGTIAIPGSVQAKGAAGAPGWDGNGGTGEGGGGGGGGGIVHLISATPVSFTNINVAGGPGAAGAGAASTTVWGGGGGACGGNGGAGGYPHVTAPSGSIGRVVQTQRTPASVY